MVAGVAASHARGVGMAAKRSLARVAGLDVDILSRLESQNFRTCEDVLTRHPLDLVEMLDVNLPVAEKIVACVARACCPRPVTAAQLLASRTEDPAEESTDPPTGRDASTMNDGGGASTSGAGSSVNTKKTPAYVRAHLYALDKALGGGVPTGSISELVGPSGAGKTQMCLTLACACAAPRSCGGLESGVVFIDTEQKFSSQRLAEIAVAKFPAAFSPALNPPGHERELEALTSRVLVLTPSTLSEMLQRLNGLEEALIDRGVSLLVGKFFFVSVWTIRGGLTSCFLHSGFRRRVGSSAVWTRATDAAAGAAWSDRVRAEAALGAARDGGVRDEPGHHAMGRRASGARRDEGRPRRRGGGRRRRRRLRDGGARDQVGALREHPPRARWCRGCRREGERREDAGYHQRRREIKVVKSPRCPLVGFECDVYAGGIRVDGDKVVKVDPSGADAQGGIRGIYQGAAV